MRPHLLFQAQKKFPSNTGIIENTKKINYSEYFLICCQIGRYLQVHYHVGSKTKVALQLENSLIYALLIMSLQILGAITIHVSPLFPVELTKTLLNEIFDAGVTNILITQKEIAFIQKFIELQILDPNEILKRSMAKVQNDEKKNGNMFYISNQAWVDMTFTSATKGKPKVVVHTYGNHYYSALGSNMNLRLEPNDLWLINLPLFHVGGQAILYRAALSGAGVIFTKFSNIENILAQYRITHLSVVPTQLHRLLENPKICAALSKLKVILVGGDKLPKNLLRTALNKKLKLYTSYGSSEMSSQITTQSKAIKNECILDSGNVLPFRKINITNKKEIIVKGPCLFSGYYKQKKICLPLDQDAYFHTGDLGELSDSGALTILGRKDNMFISGGENIYPEEIERELEKIEYVQQTAFVVGLPSAEFGMRPVAFIKLKPNAPWTQKTFSHINQQLEKKLPHFKIPIQYFKLPRQKGFKQSRKELENYAKHD